MSKDQVKTIKCPFLPHHVMPYERFLSHLEKCQFPNKKSYRKCKFNPYHVHHMDVIVSHQNKCPDRNKYEVEDDDDWGVLDVPQKQEKQDWESEISFTNASQSYNSKKSISVASSQPKKEKENKNKYSNKDDYDNSSMGKKVEKGQPINNSVIEVQDLDDYNPC